MKISIIIPNYNGEDLIKKNLPRVIDSLIDFKEEVEIIIIDDCSSDSSVDVIKEFIEKNKNNNFKIKLVENVKNKGFSSNVNKGVDNAEGEILVLLNTDVIPSANFLDPILPLFRDEKVFGVGCMDESVEGDKKVMRGRGRGEWKRGFLMHSKASVEGSDTLWVSGGSGVFRRSIWEEFEGLDELYNPFYWEDIDLSYRARKAGYKTLFENRSRVTHEHDKGAIKSKFNLDEIKKIAYRNQFIFSWKNSDFSTLILGIIWLPYHLLKATFSRDKALIIGFLSAFKLLPKILKQRKKANKGFIMSDKEATLLLT